VKALPAIEPLLSRQSIIALPFLYEGNNSKPGVTPVKD